MKFSKNAASKSALVRRDIRESGQCGRNGCQQNARKRIREDSEIVPLCNHCAAKTLGVNEKLFDTTANLRAESDPV